MNDRPSPLTTTPRPRPPLLLATVTVAVVALHLLGRGPLVTPHSPTLDAVLTWAGDRDPVTVAFSAIRLIALVVAYHLLLTLTIAHLGRRLRSVRLVRLAERITLPLFRGLVRRALGLGMAGSILVTGPATVGASSPGDRSMGSGGAGTAIMQQLPDEGEATMELLVDDLGDADRIDPDSGVSTDLETGLAPDDDENVDHRDEAVDLPPAPPATPIELAPSTTGPTTPASSPTSTSPRDADRDAPVQPAPDAPTTAAVDESTAIERKDTGDHRGPTDVDGGGAPESEARRPASPTRETRGSLRHTVEPGDHLWALAEQRISDAGTPDPDDTLIARYWRRVVDANEHLGDPDLIFPGDVVELPPLP